MSSDKGILTIAREIVERAEADLGKLSDGQRRDLLKDNTQWDSDTVAAAVAAINPDSPVWRREFPDFDSMPEIPAAWHDTSWHNDTCPSFRICGDVYGANAVSVFVDYADSELREHPESEERFSVYATDETGSERRAVYHGNEWPEVLRLAEIERLAWTFAVAVQAEFTPTEWRTMRVVNRGNVDNGVCASHDFRDANEIMAAAFAEVAGRELWLCSDVEEGRATDAQQGIDCALWNAAWAIATPMYLTSDAEGERFDAWCESGRDVTLALNPDFGPVQRLYDGNATLDAGLSDSQWCVTVANLTAVGTLAECERYLWAWHAKEESA